MDAIESCGTPIQEFFRDTNIFITGGTGFMGKVIIEKILRSCNGVNNIYLLIRRKKGKEVDTRLEELFDDPLFNTLKGKYPKFEQKVSAIPGDCNTPGLGLSPLDHQKLIEDVNIVFHGAATVRFDEKLRSAVGINVLGTKYILDLAQEMKSLKSLIHISTAYCNCHLKEIDEKFYTYPMSHRKLLSVVESVSDNVLDNITRILLGDWPNTYAYTKAMAEDLVRDRGPGLPIGVFRPAVVVPTNKEPVEGWTDNIYGPTGIYVGVATGFIKSFYCDKDKLANIVPVDMAVNALIAAAWEVGSRNRPGTADDIPIYNYVSTVQNPLTLHQFVEKGFRYGLEVPFMRAIWCYCLTLNKHRSVHMLYIMLFHFLPALVVDSVAALFGKSPELMKMYTKINKFSEVISYFCVRDWKFIDQNVQSLWRKLDKEDQKTFDFNIAELDWEKFLIGYVRGVRIYIMKEDPKTIPNALVKQRRLRLLHNGVKVVIMGLVARKLWSTCGALFRSHKQCK